MKWLIWFFLFGLFYSPLASGQSVNIGRPNVVTSQGGSGLDARVLTICLVSDTQNIVSAFSGTTPSSIPPATALNCATDTSYGCSGAFCTQSPFCKESWYATGNLMMRNMAYDLTGQWSKIDWTGITNRDNVITKPNRPLYHQPCDLILSLGDMTDVPNTLGYGNHVASSAGTLTSLGYDYQNETNRRFWAIIKASGIPYLPLQGNHDPWVWFQSLMTMLNFESESFFYDKEDTYGLSYAILVNPTRLGKPICVVGVAFSDNYLDTGAQPTRAANTNSWVAATTGCGGNHPTIFLEHQSIISGSATSNAGAAVPLDTVTGSSQYARAGVTGASEIFMAAGGHWTTAAESTKGSYTGLFGVDADQTVYIYYSNWQETDRKGTTPIYGPTTRDSNGGWYTIVTIEAERDRICAYDWSPYWQVPTGGTSNGQTANITTTSGCQAFDFDARFP